MRYFGKIRAARRTEKFFASLAVLAIALLARPACGAELALLSNGFSIRHDHHQVMGETTRLFLSTDDSSFTDVPTATITGYEPAPAPATVSASAPAPAPVPAPTGVTKLAPLPLNQVVDSASAVFHLDPDLVNSVIHAESGFNSHAISPKGARGLMQLMPGTASQLGVNDVFDPEANVTGGSLYLRQLLERYNFDLVKALAAYNAGPQRVDQYQGVPPFRETRAYVARIVKEYNRKKVAQEKAAAKPKPTSPKTAGPAHPAAKPAANATVAETSR
ncbi:MAG: lytic transglycosylase domain-containing protein [Terriglobales bacterium]|jgi:soluble lytic murein transglycosylase-like protein